MSADDPDAARILDALRAQRRQMTIALALSVVVAAVALYRPIAHGRWPWAVLGAGLFGLIGWLNVAGTRRSRPDAPAARALLDEPARITAIDPRGGVVFAYVDRQFTVLRPRDPTLFVDMLRARCPQATVGRPA